MAASLAGQWPCPRLQARKGTAKPLRRPLHSAVYRYVRATAQAESLRMRQQTAERKLHKPQPIEAASGLPALPAGRSVSIAGRCG